MPIYEYFCPACIKVFSVLRSMEERDNCPECTLCGALKTRRRVSRFRTIRSEDQILDALADPSKLGDLDESDPRSLAKWAGKLAREMGEDIGAEIEAIAEDELAGGANYDDMGPGEPSPLASMGGDSVDD